MFTYVTLGADDVEASRKFYDAALGALGIGPGQGPDPKGRYWWRTDRGAFAVGKPIDGAPASAFGKLVLAYLRDPAGNKICALHRPG